MDEQVPAPEKKNYCHKRGQGTAGACGAIYGFGAVGAAVYFLQHATSFWMGALGILKAIVWPALVVYRLLDFLKF